MQSIVLLIKPASSSCNMRCRYCFYSDVASKREIISYGIMSDQTLEHVVQKSLAAASHECTFLFQGGEPTMAGIQFYQKLLLLEQKHNVKRLNIHHGIQTNGLLIDREWADFFVSNHFLVGLSLDGNKAAHDAYRLDMKGNGTFSRVLRAAQLLDSAGADYNILTVVTAQLATNIDSVYGFYKRGNLRYQQYIACLDPLNEPRGGHEYSLTPAIYAKFLKQLFDLWFWDVTRGEQVSIRYFDNLVLMLSGRPAESCGMSGKCSRQIVVEADGEVYPCDFYVLDRYRLGNLNNCSFADIEKKRDASGFIRDSVCVAKKCVSCEWQVLCHGGCRRDRETDAHGNLEANYFCEAYKVFFSYAIDRLQELARRYNG